MGELVQGIVIAQCPFILVGDGNRQVVCASSSLTLGIVPSSLGDGQQAESHGVGYAGLVVQVVTARPFADDGVDRGRGFPSGVVF